MAVLDDQLHAHVGVHEHADQHPERDGHQHALNDRHRTNGGDHLFGHRRHDVGIVMVGAHDNGHAQPDGGEHQLQRRERSGEPQRGKAGLRHHFSKVFVSCIAPATCGGIYFSSCFASRLVAVKLPSGLKRPSATTPDRSRNRSGTMPAKATGVVA